MMFLPKKKLPPNGGVVTGYIVIHQGSVHIAQATITAELKSAQEPTKKRRPKDISRTSTDILENKND